VNYFGRTPSEIGDAAVYCSESCLVVGAYGQRKTPDWFDWMSNLRRYPERRIWDLLRWGAGTAQGKDDTAVMTVGLK